MEEASRRCPKCSSASYTPPTCVICGYSAWVPSGDFRMASERRLGAAFAELDRLYGDGGNGEGDGREEPMPDEAKVYRCRHCKETFPTPQGLAGHSRHHRHQARVAAGRGSPAPPTEVSEAALWANPPAPAAPGGNGLLCPTCSTALPAAVRVVAESFTAEGVDDDLATKLAVKAFGLLRVPA